MPSRQPAGRRRYSLGAAVGGTAQGGRDPGCLDSQVTETAPARFNQVSDDVVEERYEVVKERNISEPTEKSTGKNVIGRADCSAGVPPAVSGASRPRFGEVIIRDRGRLPHWEKESGTYFLTFRLSDSLPRVVLDRIEFEKRNMVMTASQVGRDLSPDERRRMSVLSSARIERYLDSGAGACHLRKPEIATLVRNALFHFEEQRYRLFAWCIMPNHVHVVARFFPGNSLSAVLHSWKSYTAKRAKDLLEIDGRFWQREYYDHLLDTEAEFERAVAYVVANPQKAGLQNWSWVWVRGQDALATGGGTPALP
jgi:REP element-mobilizing transposase RayT